MTLKTYQDFSGKTIKVEFISCEHAWDLTDTANNFIAGRNIVSIEYQSAYNDMSNQLHSVIIVYEDVGDR